MPTPKPPFPVKPLPPDRRAGKGMFAKAVGSFVPKVAAKAFEKFGFHSAEIMAEWPRVAGAEIAAFTKPERIKWPRNSEIDENGVGTSGGATLVLRVMPARALDVEYRSGEIIDRINRYFGYRAIAQLRIVQAPIVETAVNDGGRAVAPTASGVPADLPPAEVPEATDPAVKSALEGLWASIGAERRRR